MFAQQCDTCGSTAHGPLRVHGDAAPLVSVSYAGAFVVVGVAPLNATAFGIDAEPDAPGQRAAAVDALREARTSPTLTDWTRIEAAAKARGQGLRGEWHLPDPALTCFDLVLPAAPVALTLSVALSVG